MAHVTRATAPEPGRLAAARRLTPVKVLAPTGAALLLFEAYAVVSWVTGPFFERVPSGPDIPPTWMRVALIVAQVVSPLVAIVVLYLCLIRPWRRTGTPTSDGLLCVALLLTSVYDPLGDLLHTWFTYNSYMVNFGSLLGVLPGGGAHSPGATAAFPILFIPGVYVWAFMALIVIGCKLMGAVRNRWPQLHPAALIGVCVAVMAVGDFVLEGLVMQRLGLHTYNGGVANLFAGSYFQYPLFLPLVLAPMLALMASYRFFTNDRGETLPERGAAQLRTGPRRRILVRLLAILAAVQLTLLLVSHLPAMLLGNLDRPWPDDISNRSYLTDNMCGHHLNLPCPPPQSAR